jgi:hypothetical protein
MMLEFRCPHPIILFAPTVVGLLNNADLPDCVNTGHPLPDKHFNLPRLGDDLFGFISIVRHL